MTHNKNDSLAVVLVFFAILGAIMLCAADPAYPAPAISPLAVPPTPAPRPTPTYTNVLRNAGMERDWIERAPGVWTARNWMPFNDGVFSEFSGTRYPDGWYRAHTGEMSQKIFVVGRTTNWTGVYQTIPCSECDNKNYVTHGALLVTSVAFEAWTGQWCPNTPGFWLGHPKWQYRQPTSLWRSPEPCAQTIDADNVQARICIDQSGGTDPLAATLVCSEWQSSNDHYSILSVSAQAVTNTATVFIGYRNKYGLEINNAYFDDARLVELWPAAYLPIIERSAHRSGMYGEWVTNGNKATLYLRGLRPGEILQAVEAHFLLDGLNVTNLATSADFSEWRTENDLLIFEGESAAWAGPIFQIEFSGSGCMAQQTGWAFFLGLSGGGGITPPVDKLCK